MFEVSDTIAMSAIGGHHIGSSFLSPLHELPEVTLLKHSQSGPVQDLQFEFNRQCVAKGCGWKGFQYTTILK